MTKVSLTRLMILCAAVAACADTSTNRMMTAPDAGPARSDAAADLGVSYTPDGAFDFTSASENALAQLPGAQLAAVQLGAATQSASGSRSSGHVGFPTGISGTIITSEKYSYTALSTDPATPFAAKGEYELTLSTASIGTRKVQGDVICMKTFGNTALVGGQITKYWVNGVQAPIPATGTHNIWVVVDNGEGNGIPDQVSLMRFSNAATAQFFCANGLPSVVFFNQEGTVQVQP
jgi:hypothetical protein